jgi:hypothetical protein
MDRPKRKRVLFEFYMPGARQVELVLHPDLGKRMCDSMKQDGRGLWHKIKVLDPGRYRHQLLVDGRSKDRLARRVVVSGASLKDSNELHVFLPSTREI